MYTRNMTKKQVYELNKKKVFDELDQISKDREPHKITMNEIQNLHDSMYYYNIKPSILKNRIKRTRHICSTNKDRLTSFLFAQKPSLYVLLNRRYLERKDYKNLEPASRYMDSDNKYVYDVLAIIGSGEGSFNSFFDGLDITVNNPFGEYAIDVHLNVGYPLSSYWYNELFNQSFKRKNIYDPIRGTRVYTEVLTAGDFVHMYDKEHQTYSGPLTANFTVK